MCRWLKRRPSPHTYSLETLYTSRYACAHGIYDAHLGVPPSSRLYRLARVHRLRLPARNLYPHQPRSTHDFPRAAPATPAPRRARPHPRVLPRELAARGLSPPCTVNTAPPPPAFQRPRRVLCLPVHGDHLPSPQSRTSSPPCSAASRVRCTAPPTCPVTTTTAVLLSTCRRRSSPRPFTLQRSSTRDARAACMTAATSLPLARYLLGRGARR
ncbi:hypothetical protein B0H12DRAFT_126502 [Mycena haematopus]|nr:hypothetical protein B0H12DRAFT_126502 [Mycena haematopus]